MRCEVNHLGVQRSIACGKRRNEAVQAATSSPFMHKKCSIHNREPRAAHAIPEEHARHRGCRGWNFIGSDTIDQTIRWSAIPRFRKFLPWKRGCSNRSTGNPIEGSSQSLETAQMLGNSLCEVCDAVDFWSLFAKDSLGSKRLGSLMHVFSCSSCPLCRCVANAVKERSSELSNVAHYTWEVFQCGLSAQDYLRHNNVAPYYRIRIVLYRETH